MKKVDKIICEVAASFQIDNIRVSSEVIDNSKKRLELLLNKDNNSCKSLIRKVRK